VSSSVAPLVRSLLAGLTRYAPQRRAAMVIALSSVVWLLPAPFGAYAGLTTLACFVLALAVDMLLLPPRASVAIVRDFPPQVGIGDDAVGHYTVANRTTRPIGVELHDRFPDLLRGGVGHCMLHVTAGAAQQVPFTATGMTRGASTLGAVGAKITTRLGLMGVTYAYDLAADVRVIPSMSGVRRYRLMAMQQRLSTLGVRALRRKGSGQAFAGLREYVRGDDPRHIDWKATSKRDKLITREFTVERSQTVITLIDAGRAMTQLSGTWSRFEQALSSALILTDIASNAGDRVGTLVFDDEIRAHVPAHASRGALTQIRNAFVPVSATTREPDYASAFRFLATHQRKRALVVFFTDVIDIRASQALLAHVSRSAARHLVLVVALRNDQLFEAAAVPADTTATRLFEAAAAEEVIQARDAVLHRMRRAGVIVLDVSPRVMTAGVVNQYLDLKNRGAL
jgi:uncharacterized protein (DUF58 family)